MRFIKYPQRGPDTRAKTRFVAAPPIRSSAARYARENPFRRRAAAKRLEEQFCAYRTLTVVSRERVDVYAGGARPPRRHT